MNPIKILIPAVSILVVLFYGNLYALAEDDEIYIDTYVYSPEFNLNKNWTLPDDMEFNLNDGYSRSTKVVSIPQIFVRTHLMQDISMINYLREDMSYGYRGHQTFKDYTIGSFSRARYFIEQYLFLESGLDSGKYPPLLLVYVDWLGFVYMDYEIKDEMVLRTIVRKPQTDSPYLETCYYKMPYFTLIPDSTRTCYDQETVRRFINRAIEVE